MNERDDEVLAAHARGDKARLVTLYAEAADHAASEDEAGFFLTFAYVFALETGHPMTARLKSRLVAAGRDE